MIFEVSLQVVVFDQTKIEMIPPHPNKSLECILSSEASCSMPFDSKAPKTIHGTGFFDHRTKYLKPSEFFAHRILY